MSLLVEFPKFFQFYKSIGCAIFSPYFPKKTREISRLNLPPIHSEIFGRTCRSTIFFQTENEQRREIKSRKRAFHPTDWRVLILVRSGGGGGGGGGRGRIEAGFECEFSRKRVESIKCGVGGRLIEISRKSWGRQLRTWDPVSVLRGEFAHLRRRIVTRKR